MMKGINQPIPSGLTMTKEPVEKTPAHPPNSPLSPLPTQQAREGYLGEQVIYLF
jgi:hypothetical protein